MTSDWYRLLENTNMNISITLENYIKTTEYKYEHKPNVRKLQNTNMNISITLEFHIKTTEYKHEHKHNVRILHKDYRIKT